MKRIISGLSTWLGLGKVESFPKAMIDPNNVGIKNAKVFLFVLFTDSYFMKLSFAEQIFTAPKIFFSACLSSSFPLPVTK